MTTYSITTQFTIHGDHTDADVLALAAASHAQVEDPRDDDGERATFEVWNATTTIVRSLS